MAAQKHELNKSGGLDEAIHNNRHHMTVAAALGACYGRFVNFR
jgi:hypothetical protein